MLSHDSHMTRVLFPTAQELVLEVLQALTSDTKIVKECLYKGDPALLLLRSGQRVIVPPPPLLQEL